MRKILPFFAMMVLMFGVLVGFSGCSVVGGIFKAGVWVGVLVVVFVILLIGFLVSRGKK